MREVLFRAKRTDNGRWIEGYYMYHLNRMPSPVGDGLKPGDEEHIILFDSSADWNMPREITYAHVDPGTIGQYTGMREFVMTDPSVRRMLFEGDIVEVWTNRRPCTEYGPTSQYDGKRKVRATVVFKNGGWKLDYDNAYNHNMEKLHGKEDLERTVKGAPDLFRYGCHDSAEREAWRREHNKNYIWDDIVCIGNIHDNPELMEV